MPGRYRIPKPRGPGILRSPLEFTLKQKKEEPPYSTPPPEWPGSLAEWAVAWALTQLGEEWQYQVPLMGGRLQQGGTVADFVVPERQLVIRVMGVFWHYERGPLVVNVDAFLKQALEGQGWVVVDIDEDDALADPIYYVKEALMGRDHSRAERGV